MTKGIKPNMTLLMGLLLIFGLLGLSPHPYHVSYTEIAFDKTNQELTFAVEVFTDDLENAVKWHSKKEKIFLGKSPLPDSTERAIQHYITQVMGVYVDGVYLKSAQFLPTETNPDRTTIYFSYSVAPTIKSLTIQSELLLDLLSDQENILEFKHDDQVEKALLSGDKRNHTWSFH